MTWSGAITVVAGNGPSLARILPGRVCASDRMVRLNNFFFERAYYLGRRVDLAVIGGDPRVAPFVFKTLHQQSAAYQIAAWTTHDSRLIAPGQRRLTVAYTPVRYRPAHQRLVEALQAKTGLKPTSGIFAVMAALALWDGPVLLAGIDLYSGSTRYAYAPTRHQRDLLGADLHSRGYDTRLHSQALDRQILGALAEDPDVTLWRSTRDGPLTDLMDLAPHRPGTTIAPVLRTPPTDWAARAGLYPVAALKAMRRLRTKQRQLTA
ncbi:MAG: hypothetical protein GDA36_09745 [Rhodobacteraceae bacterium]|nr:hypothetical protein [Paracoccaceae bacterium]